MIIMGEKNCLGEEKEDKIREGRSKHANKRKKKWERTDRGKKTEEGKEEKDNKKKIKEEGERKDMRKHDQHKNLQVLEKKIKGGWL